jgi:anti-anti-sigma factor
VVPGGVNSDRPPGPLPPSPPGGLSLSNRSQGGRGSFRSEDPRFGHTVKEASPPIDGAPFDLSVRDLDGTRFVTVSGEVDVSVADTLTEALSGQRVFVDMSGVSLIDSTGTSCLLVALDRSESLVLRTSAPVQRLLELAGVSQLFPAPDD